MVTYEVQVLIKSPFLETTALRPRVWAGDLNKPLPQDLCPSYQILSHNMIKSGMISYVVLSVNFTPGFQEPCYWVLKGSRALSIMSSSSAWTQNRVCPEGTQIIRASQAAIGSKYLRGLLFIYDECLEFRDSRVLGFRAAGFKV